MNVTTLKRFDKARHKDVEQPLWTMPRFKSANAIVGVIFKYLILYILITPNFIRLKDSKFIFKSFRTSEARLKSYQQFEQEKPGKVGVTHRGIEVAATS